MFLLWCKIKHRHRQNKWHFNGGLSGCYESCLTTDRRQAAGTHKSSRQLISFFFLFRFFISHLFVSLTTIFSPSSSFFSPFYCIYHVFCLLFFHSFSFSFPVFFTPILFLHSSFILQNCAECSVNHSVTNCFQPPSQIAIRINSCISSTCTHTHTHTHTHTCACT